VWLVPLAQPSVTTSSTDFSFQHLVFLGISLNFQGGREIIIQNIQKLLHHKSKTSWNQAHGWMDPSLLLRQELSKDTKNKQRSEGIVVVVVRWIS